MNKLFPLFKEDAQMMAYFPDRLPKGRLPDRSYFYNVMHTLYPDYTTEMIKVAQNHRNQASQTSDDLGIIRVTYEWWQKLNELPFTKSKYLFSLNPIRT